MSDEPRIFVIPFGDVEEGDPISQEDLADSQRFQKMLNEFEHFANRSADPFAPCGFLHKLLEKAIARAYQEAYMSIGRAQDDDQAKAFLCAATHLKKCSDLSREMTEEISAAMGDMHRGGSRDHDMLSSLKNLMRMVNNGRQ